MFINDYRKLKFMLIRSLNSLKLEEIINKVEPNIGVSLIVFVNIIFAFYQFLLLQKKRNTQI